MFPADHMSYSVTHGHIMMVYIVKQSLAHGIGSKGAVLDLYSSKIAILMMMIDCQKIM